MEFYEGQSQKISWIDYLVFGILCFFASFGGLWHSYKNSKKKNIGNVKEYLLGSKTMSTFPVGLSLIASYVSGVTVLGTPAEIYNYGTQYWLVVIGIMGCCVTICKVFVPVFMALHLSSSYEYLELRFNKNVRAAASILFLCDEIFFLPMVLYVPALTLNQLTSVNLYVAGAVMAVVGGLYTTLGGLRAVVLTDALQIGVMFFGILVVLIAGVISAGGIVEVFDITSRTGRLSFDNWNFSPYERETGWGAIIGGYVYWTCFNSVNQTMVQRFLAVPTKNKAVWSVSIFGFGVILAISLCIGIGLTAWAKWVQLGCWPAGTPPIGDRLVPAFILYVTEVQNLPGLPGVFIASIFCAGLSSLSVVLNASALVVIEDLLRGWRGLELSARTQGIIARTFTAVFAVIAIAMMMVIERLGGVLSVATALSAIAASTTCGVFVLGMACWWVGPRGALVGASAGALVAGVGALGQQFTSATGALRYPPMPLHGACGYNDTAVDLHIPDATYVFPLFRVSFHWFATLGSVTTVLVGIVTGWLLDDHSVPVDPELITPLMQRFLPAKCWQYVGSAKKKMKGQAHPLLLTNVKDTNPIGGGAL